MKNYETHWKRSKQKKDKNELNLKRRKNWEQVKKRKVLNNEGEKLNDQNLKVKKIREKNTK